MSPVVAKDPVSLPEPAPPVSPKQEVEFACEGPNFGGEGKSGKRAEAKKKDEKKQEDSPVDFSGHYRLRWESQQNFDLVYSRDHLAPPGQDNDDNFLLSQLRLNLDLKPTKHFHAHFTFQDARETGSHQIDHDALDRAFQNSIQNKADLYEAWIKLRLCDAPVWLQVGRQELIYGDRRLLGNSRFRNTGRNFDALRLIFEQDDVKLDLFAANRVRVDSNAWDRADHNDNFLGAYATVKNLPHGVQDLYLLYRDNDQTHREEYSLGTRIVGDEGPWDWNLEGVYQWGSSVDTVRPFVSSTEILDHQAWAVHAELGYICKDHPLMPRLALEYDFASGDKDPFDGENNTFDQLYPNNHTPFGIMDFVGWKNIQILAPKLAWQQSKKLRMGADWFLFWQPEESNDAWYDSGGHQFRNARGASAERFMGHELNIYGVYEVNDDFEVEAGYGHFFAGGLAADTAPLGGGADDADFAYIQTTWKF
ncbi:MAG: alginate export family protein [Candidatus Omnitrophica bacterium]|nr:alginate export family protein [Candidatus Omnitrophota bacterium]